MDPWLQPEEVEVFAEDARRAVYAAIALRRDVRHFRDEPVDEAALRRVLGAAHLAPSVGFSQPWGFVVVRDRELRGRIRESFLRVRAAEAARYTGERRAAYLAHQLEGVLEAALNVCVAVDLRPRAGAILGTTAQPESVRLSGVCAVQNLWLAARAEGLGVGWVSIVEPAVLRRELELPAGVEPIAYLCVGHPRAFRGRPMLQETGWEKRRPLELAIHEGAWEEAKAPSGGAPQPASEAPSAAQPIVPVSAEVRAQALRHQDTLVKPAGSLGRLEELAAWYAAAHARFPPPPARLGLAIFAGDHGVVEEGVTAWSSAVTTAMVRTIATGGAAVNQLAREADARVSLCDVGVAGDLTGLPERPAVDLVHAKVRAGTRNLRREPALTRDEVQRALAAGAAAAARLVEQGSTLLALGEVGIGNTTAAAALVCGLTGLAPADTVGAGAGLDAQGVARKQRVVEEALAHHGRGDAWHTLTALGGLELVAGAGFLLEAARRHTPVVLDGFLSSASALAARALDPAVAGYLCASHCSAEKGARAALDALGLDPLLELGLRLGEGTGALLGAQLVRAAVAAQLGMATFATAGVVQ